MDFTDKVCEIGVKLNKKWDEVPEKIKPAASGGAILVGLLLSKPILGVGIIVFFGARVMHKMGIFEDCLKESEGFQDVMRDSNDEKDSSS